MSGHTLHTEIEIATPPAHVWTVLTDFDRWSEWNRVLVGFGVRGPLTEGASARLTIELGPPLGARPIPVKLVTVRRDRELAWTGGIPGVMTGLHGFRLEPTDRGTRLVHYETFTGLASGILIGLLKPQLYSRYRRVNDSLRDHCEQSFVAAEN